MVALPREWMPVREPVFEPAAEIGAGRQQNREVIQPGRISGPRTRSGYLGQEQERRSTGAENRLRSLAGDDLKAERTSVKLDRTFQFGDGQRHRTGGRIGVDRNMRL